MHSTSDEILRSRLLKAYEEDPNRSKMGQLRKQFDTIIDLQKGGMSLETILAVLNDGKVEDDCLTMKTFNGYLYLLRKERVVQPGISPHTDSVPSIPTKPKKTNGSKKASTSTATTITPTPAPAPVQPAVVDKPASVGDIKKSLSGKTDFSNFNVD